MKRLISSLLVTTSMSYASTNPIRVIWAKVESAPKVNEISFKAVRDAYNCRQWYWFPAELTRNENIALTHSVKPKKIEGVDQWGFASTYQASVSSPNITEDKLDELRTKIAQFINNKKGPDANLLAYRNCPELVNPEEINLVSFDLLAKTGENENEFKVNLQHDSIISIDSLVPISLYKDATNPEAYDFLSDMEGMFKQDYKYHAGSMYVSSKGVMPLLNVKMTVKGNFSAEFISKLQKISCTETHDSNFGVDFGIQSTSVEGLSTVTSNLGLGYHETNSKTCLSQLLTNIKDPATFLEVKFDLGDIAKDYTKRVCNESGCKEIPLDEYIKLDLITNFMTQQMGLAIKEVSENTFNITLGKQGMTHGKVDQTIHYLANYVDDVSLALPVTIYTTSRDKLNKSFFADKQGDFTGLYKCLSSNYATQLLIYPHFADHGFVPASESCLKP